MSLLKIAIINYYDYYYCEVIYEMFHNYIELRI